MSASSTPAVRRMKILVYNRNPRTMVDIIVIVKYTTMILLWRSVLLSLKSGVTPGGVGITPIFIGLAVIVARCFRGVPAMKKEWELLELPRPDFEQPGLPLIQLDTWFSSDSTVTRQGDARIIPTLVRPHMLNNRDTKRILLQPLVAHQQSRTCSILGALTRRVVNISRSKVEEASKKEINLIYLYLVYNGTLHCLSGKRMASGRLCSRSLNRYLPSCTKEARKVPTFRPGRTAGSI